MADPSPLPTAPSDEACNAAFDAIARIAGEHALVMDSWSGVMVIATPQAQRQEARRARVLLRHRMREAELAPTPPPPPTVFFCALCNQRREHVTARCPYCDTD